MNSSRPPLSLTIVLLLGLASAWAATAARAGGDPATDEKLALGRKVFTQIAQPTCQTCHGLQDIKPVAEIGAKLEELKPTAERVAAAVREGVGVMPSFEGKLTDEQIAAVAYFVSRAAGGAK